MNFEDFLGEAVKHSFKPGDRVLVNDPDSVSHQRIGTYVGPKGKSSMHTVRFSNGAQTHHAITKLKPST